MKTEEVFNELELEGYTQQANREIFGDTVLRRKRMELGLSQGAMAKRIGIDQSRISRLEVWGEKPKDLATAELIARHYELNAAEKNTFFRHFCGLPALKNSTALNQLLPSVLYVNGAATKSIHDLPPHPDFSQPARAALVKMHTAEARGDLDICDELYHNWYAVLDAAGRWNVFSLQGLGYRVAQRYIATSQWERLYEYFYPALRTHLEQNKWADTLTLIEKLEEVAHESKNDSLRGLHLLGLGEYLHKYHRLTEVNNETELHESLELLYVAEPLLQDLPECLLTQTIKAKEGEQSW